MLNAIEITAANTWTEVYVVPASRRSSVTLSLCNHTIATDLLVSVAIGPATSGAITDAHYLEYLIPIAASGVYERTGIVLNATQKLWVRVTNATSLNAVVYGFEEVV